MTTSDAETRGRRAEPQSARPLAAQDAALRERLDGLKWGADGLIVAIAQSAGGGEIRMVAYASREALDATLRTGVAHFYSRSRRKLWRKGEESGNELLVRQVATDCDGDALLYMVDAQGPSCHTGAATCFFTQVAPSTLEPWPLLPRLMRYMAQRASGGAAASYTHKLLQAGPAKIAGKIREEGGELADAVAGESDARVVSESADVIYHLLAGLLARGIPLEAVFGELNRRFGMSGLEEKASRGVPAK